MHRQVVSIVTEAELLVLADRHGWGPTKRAALRTAIDSLITIPVESAELLAAYVRVSSLDFEASKGARNMGKSDMWIVATALYTELPLLPLIRTSAFGIVIACR